MSGSIFKKIVSFFGGGKSENDDSEDKSHIDKEVVFLNERCSIEDLVSLKKEILCLLKQHNEKEAPAEDAYELTDEDFSKLDSLFDGVIADFERGLPEEVEVIFKRIKAFYSALQELNEQLDYELIADDGVDRKICDFIYMLFVKHNKLFEEHAYHICYLKSDDFIDAADVFDWTKESWKPTNTQYFIEENEYTDEDIESEKREILANIAEEIGDIDAEEKLRGQECHKWDIKRCEHLLDSLVFSFSIWRESDDAACRVVEDFFDRFDEIDELYDGELIDSWWFHEYLQMVLLKNGVVFSGDYADQLRFCVVYKDSSLESNDGYSDAEIEAKKAMLLEFMGRVAEDYESVDLKKCSELFDNFAAFFESSEINASSACREVQSLLDDLDDLDDVDECDCFFLHGGVECCIKVWVCMLLAKAGIDYDDEIEDVFDEWYILNEPD